MLKLKVRDLYEIAECKKNTDVEITPCFKGISVSDTLPFKV